MSSFCLVVVFSVDILLWFVCVQVCFLCFLVHDFTCLAAAGSEQSSGAGDHPVPPPRPPPPKKQQPAQGWY